jgi:pyruvate dehydrogenase E2 component (dihydrolipoamide acetyltransferase)
MATWVALPKLGMNQEDGTIVRWVVAEGATVRAGEPVVEVETDKATVEVESPSSGILAKILRKEGEVVPINAVLAVVLAPGEQLPSSIPETIV